MKAKQIKDFPNYIITDTGEVINNKGLHLKPDLSNNGYFRVSLCNEKVKHKKLLVHRLVAEAFIPNPDNLPQINHINKNKRDNRMENLEWCSPLYNLNYSEVINKASVAKFSRIKCDTTGEVFESIKSASDKYGLHHANIVACCNGRRKTAGKKKWRYIDD